MTEYFVHKIEKIRSMPEHTRLQYTLGAVTICMLFVIGVWILTLRQGFFGVASDLNSGRDQAEDSISTVKQSLPSADSLRELKEQSESLRVESGGNADQFIESELQKSTTDSSLSY